MVLGFPITFCQMVMRRWASVRPSSSSRDSMSVPVIMLWANLCLTLSTLDAWLELNRVSVYFDFSVFN